MGDYAEEGAAKKRLGDKSIFGIQPLELQADFFTFPFSPDGIKFPSIDEVVRLFVEKNNFKLERKADFDLRNYRYTIDGGKLTTGKILELDKGLAVISNYLEINGPGNLQPTFGGGPVESYACNYVLSGELKNKDVQLRARISFTRGTFQKSTENCSGRKSYVDVPDGEFVSHVSRQDSNRKYWFVNDGNSSG